MMDRLTLSHIDEGLESSEVAALCFLCLDIVNRKRLKEVTDAKDLFIKLEEKGLLENNLFLSQLLQTIKRIDLLNSLEMDSRPPQETDANPILSDYRVMLYKIHEDITQENFQKMKFLLDGRLSRVQLENCKTPLDVFAEMEKSPQLLSKTNVQELITILRELDQQLVSVVQRYQNGVNQNHQIGLPPDHISMDAQRVNNSLQPTQPILSTPESPSSYAGERVYVDAEPNIQPPSSYNQADYYNLTHNPRGVCMIINNENFRGARLKKRGGTQEDEKALNEVFTRLGFTMVICKDLTAEDIKRELKVLGTRNFLNDDVLVVCILSHGERGSVCGTDEQLVTLKEMARPFKSGHAPTLAGKPKLFFIQACQGDAYQRGSFPCPPRQREEDGPPVEPIESDAGRIEGETVPWDADFLLGMATVQDYRSFRNTATGSIYIQELCRQLTRSAQGPENDDILTVLTRVNREVSKGEYLRHKQMPEPKYTLTKKLVLKFV